MPMWKNAPAFKVVEEGEVSSKEGDDALYNLEIRVEDDAGGFKAIRTFTNILAFTSPVFKQQFFRGLSSIKNSGDSAKIKMDIVNIQGFSFNIVKDFIELICTSNVSIVNSAKDFGYLFEILRISDMYQVLDLVDLVKGRIDEVKITLGSLVKTAGIAERYKDLLTFEEVSEGLNKNNQELVVSLMNKGLWNILLF